MRLVSDDTWALLTLYQEGRSDRDPAQLLGRAEVIRNRAKLQHLSIAAVVLAPLQFSGWNVHDPNRITAAEVDGDDPAVERCREAWTTATADPPSDVVAGATHYFDRIGRIPPPPWAAAMTETAVIGTTHFLLMKGA